MNAPAVSAPHVLLRAAPNTLSILRLALAIALPFLGEAWWLATVAVAGITDWLDGFLARRFELTSRVGGFLDGLADKLFVFSALLVLAGHGLFPAWWVPLLLCRDVIVALGTAIALIRRNRRALRDLGSRVLGKVTTILVFGLLVARLGLPDREQLHGTLFVLAATCSVAAAFDYGRVRLRGLTAPKEEDPQPS